MKTLAPQVEAAVKPGTVQRKCGCADSGKCSCHEPEKEPGVIQRRARGGAAGPAPAFPASRGNSISPSVTQGIQQSAGSGHSLPAGVRSQMESGFGGRDLSQVRVHSDSHAHQLADSLHAHAFTTGSNIYFAQNQYRPDTLRGQHLLAHELTHVVQQGSSAPGAIQPRLELGAVDTAAEREADRVADGITSGRAASPVVASPRTAVQRAAASPKTQALDKGGKAIVLPASEPLMLPSQKADSAKDLDFLVGIYEKAAKDKRLRTTHAGRASGLWSMWAAGRQNVPDVSKFKTRLSSTCSPDHMQELQVNGDDNANNLRLLSQGRNEHAGSQIAGQIRSLENKYKVDENSWLEFTAVKKLNESEAVDDPCLSHEEPMTRPGGATTVSKDFNAFVFVAGGARLRIGVEHDGTIPRVHRFAVAGAQMNQVVEQGDGTHLIHAIISPKIVDKFPVQGKASKFDFKTDGPQPTGTRGWPNLLLATPGPLSLNFPKMSPATITPFIEGGQWRAKGELTPTLPVLSKTKVFLEVGDGKLSGGVKLDPGALKGALPIPGLTIDPVTLEIKIDDGEFSATGGFDFRYGTLAKGSVTASFSKTDDFGAAGTLDMTIPGIDKAEGKAWIHNHGEFGGEITVDTKQVKFPGVKAGHLKVAVDNGVLAGSGTIDLAIPGLDNASLTFRADSTGQFGIDGTAKGKIPGLKDAQVDISYSPGLLVGKGHAGLIVPGLESASIDLVYVNGLFSGSATLAYKKGKLGGMVHAAISPAHKLSGRGELSYEIAPKLIALVGIELREDGTSKIDGELTLPDPLKLFELPPIEKTLFHLPPIEFPIFAIPVGPKSIGVVGKIGAGLKASVGIGPGVIKNGKILASFDPSKDDGAFGFEAAGIVYVPAHAGLILSLDGSIGLDLLVVEADGTLGVTAAAELLGELTMPIDLKYMGGKFSIDATATVGVRPHFEFRGHAGVKVFTDLYFTDITYYENTWDLGGFSWDPDFQIALIFPVHYVFGEPFGIDTDKIQFIHPEFSFKALMKSILPE